MIGYTLAVNDTVAMSGSDSTLMTVLSVSANGLTAVCQRLDLWGAARGIYGAASFPVTKLMLISASSGTANPVLTTAANGGNTGTSVVTSTKLTNGNLWPQPAHTITFTSPTAYTVKDSTNNVVTTGVYASPTSISFKGVTIKISGTPVTGDYFTITPTGYLVTG